MRAAVIHRYGGPDVLTLEDRPEPAVGDEDVLIDVVAASLNPLDYKIRGGGVKMVLRLDLPQILGCDVAGRVRSVGAGVTRFAPGDEVFSRLEKSRMGGLAECVAANQHVVAKKPGKATFVEAAAIPLAALTSLQALRSAAKLEPDMRVLIHAGAGGVGSLAIQLAKILGLWVATTTSKRNADFVRSLGADEVVDYTSEDFTQRLSGLDAVFDTLGPDSEKRSFEVLKPGGVVVGVGGLPDAAFAREWLPWFARPAIAIMTLGRKRAAARANARFEYLFMRPDGDELAEISGWIDAGKLKPIVHKTYPLAEVHEAFAELERGRARGKIVVSVRDS